MNNSETNSTGKIIASVLLGATVGAALGILFAPDKGSRTRRRILNGAQDLTEDLTTKFKEQVDNFRNKAEEFAEDTMGDLNKNHNHSGKTAKH